MNYARQDPNNPGRVEVRDFAVAPPSAKGWLPLVIDAQPSPSAAQVVVDAGFVFEGGQVRQTWALREKTQAEIEAEELTTEKGQIATYLADVKTQLDITNAARGALTNAQRLNELEKDTRATMRAVKYLLRQAKQQG